MIKYLILLINLGITSCSLISVPQPIVNLPKQKYKVCEKPKQLMPIPDKMIIEIDTNNVNIDDNGEKFLEEYVNMQLWIKKHYY